MLGTLLVAPVGLFVELPDVTERGCSSRGLDGLLMAAAYGITFRAFARCPMSIVTPIVSVRGSGGGGDRDRVRRAAGPAHGRAAPARGRRRRAGRYGRPDGRAGIAARRLVRGRGLADLGPRAVPRRASHRRTRGLLGVLLRPHRRLDGDAAVPPAAGDPGGHPERAVADARLGRRGTPAATSATSPAAASGPVALAGVLAAQFATVGTMARP